MSDEQQQAAIGRTVEEYAACRKKLATLQATSAKIGNSLTQLGQFLRTTEKYTAHTIMTIVTAVNQETMNFPTVDSLRALALDLKTEMERREQLFTTLKNMGFEPRD
jgi:hypothetical protein